jgi:predicted membrane GTPase involved in stress response
MTGHISSSGSLHEGSIGLRNLVLTATEGEAVMAHRFDSYEPWKGEMPLKRNGSLVAMETGTATSYAIDKLQDRGRFFIFPGEEVYMGQVIGESRRQDDIAVNVTKAKKLTNMRASGSDDKAVLAPQSVFSLEEAMEYIATDEYIEITHEINAPEERYSLTRTTAKEPGMANNSFPGKSGYQVLFSDSFFKFLFSE